MIDVDENLNSSSGGVGYGFNADIVSKAPYRYFSNRTLSTDN
jgi:hypothetical protein